MQRPTLSGIESALERLRPHLPETPLIRSELLSRAFNADVWLKYEIMSPIASFKLRGALNAVLVGAKSGIARAVTSSTGNHGQGVAYAARQIGVPADIFIPNPVNPVKAAMMRAFGATVHVVGDDIDMAKDAAREFAKDNAGLFLDDGEDIDIMEGAGTMGLEVVRSLPELDAMVVPTGGGNLASGTATALKGVIPSAKLYSVQASGSPAVAESFHARKIVERPIDTIADGLMTRVPPSLALEVLWELLDDAWLVTDDEILAGIHTLIECAHVLVEPAGSAALAGAWEHKELFADKQIMIMLSGANITTEHVTRALNTKPLFRADDV
jgi:threonine dehydratase